MSSPILKRLLRNRNRTSINLDAYHVMLAHNGEYISFLGAISRVDPPTSGVVVKAGQFDFSDEDQSGLIANT